MDKKQQREPKRVREKTIKTTREEPATEKRHQKHKNKANPTTSEALSLQLNTLHSRHIVEKTISAGETPHQKSYQPEGHKMAAPANNATSSISDECLGGPGPCYDHFGRVKTQQDGTSQTMEELPPPKERTGTAAQEPQSTPRDCDTAQHSKLQTDGSTQNGNARQRRHTLPGTQEEKG